MTPVEGARTPKGAEPALAIRWERDPRIGRRAWLLFGAVTLGSFLIRLPFQSDRLIHGDSAGLALGALFTWTAHPPGFIGYCALGRFVNYLVGDINQSFVLIGMVAAGLATGLVFLLGWTMFSEREGLIAALLFGTSIDLSYFSEVALTYAAEGFFATAVGTTGWLALRNRSLGMVLLHTAAIGLGGSVRQTTLAFLLPLWAYVVWRAAPLRHHRIAAAALLAACVALWAVPNARSLHRYWDKGQRGYLGSVYNLQVRMEQYYDSSRFGAVDYTPTEARFHWPLVELVVGAVNEIRPPRPSAPPEVRSASMSVAAKMISYQTTKLGSYLLLAAGPGLLLLGLLAAGSFRRFVGREELLYCAIWVLPAAGFFALNHLGSWGYLLILLAPLTILIARALCFLPGRRTAAFGASVLVAFNLAFFHLLGPLPDIGNRNKVLNVALFQYTAAAIEQNFARARSSTFRADPRQLPVDCTTDDCWVARLPRDFHLTGDVRPMRSLRRATFR